MVTAMNSVRVCVCVGIGRQRDDGKAVVDQGLTGRCRDESQGVYQSHL